MLCSMKMLGSVLILRGITASYMAAFHAHAQVDPAVAGLHAVFADMRFRPGDLGMAEMAALSGHVAPSVKA